MAFLSPSPLELMMIAVIALIVLGPSRLPEAARSIGRGMREMRSSFQSASVRDHDPAPPVSDDDVEDDHVEDDHVEDDHVEDDHVEDDEVERGGPESDDGSADAPAARA